MKDRANIQLYNADCLPAMRLMKDNAFDLAIVDPPYGIGISKVKNIGYGDNYDHRDGTKITCKRNEWKVKDWDVAIPTVDYFNELLRVSKNQIIWGINYFNIKFSSGRVVWNKSQTHNNFIEIAGISSKSNSVIFNFLWNGYAQGKDTENGHIIQGNKSLYEKRIHPTQKPKSLYRWLLTNYAKEGDRILDTHLGSGSIALACWDLGFDLTGYEIDKEYYDGAMKRLNNHKAQIQLF